MQDLFSSAGATALCGLDSSRCLLMFDLDGTLAPIVPQPSDAVVSAATAARLAELCQHWHVAVITGRGIDDAVGRLGFEPHYIAGNHGAESPQAVQADSCHQALASCRQKLLGQADTLRQNGIVLEDKGLSLALHYRGAADPSAAVIWLNQWAAMLSNEVHATHGHFVLNITPKGAWDKGDSLLSFMRECNASQSLVVGDDTNDEPAFAKAPMGSVTVRIGEIIQPTSARFSLASQERLNPLLDLLLRLRA
jgi:trehalose 6-phosphate phosphatase